MSETFSELYAQLPRGKRSPRNAVLVGLFVLRAENLASAVDSNAISAELKLRLGKAAPGNVPDVLRKAIPRVECTRVGKNGLRWHLTATGVDELRSYGIHVSQEKATPAARTFDVAIVCALHSPELHEVMNAFGGESKWQNQPDFGQTHIYKSIDIALPGGASLSVVAGAPTHMGLTATAIIATQMLLMFRPRLIVMVGIAAGTKASGRSYGDILVANPSVDYASGKIAVVDGVETFQPDPFPLPVDSRLHTLVQEDRRTRDGLDEIANAWRAVRPRTPLNIHIGPLGAADQVVDSEKRIVDIKKNWRKLIGVEMETYALYRAAHEAPRPKPLYVSFKSVCDFAASKDDAWQEYAAFTAAQYCRRFLLKNWSALRT